MEENANISVWQKKQDELTVGESMAIAFGVTVAMTAVTFAMFVGAGAVAGLLEKRRAKKDAELAIVTNAKNN